MNSEPAGLGRGAYGYRSDMQKRIDRDDAHQRNEYDQYGLEDVFTCSRFQSSYPLSCAPLQDAFLSHFLHDVVRRQHQYNTDHVLEQSDRGR